MLEENEEEEEIVKGDELPLELQCRCKCVLEVENCVNYPQDGKRRDWKELELKNKIKLEEKAERRKRHCKSRMIEFETGQLVMVKKENVSNASLKISAKLNPLYVGPFEVLKRLGLSTYVIGSKEAVGKGKIYKIRNLYPYVKRNQYHVGGMMTEVMEDKKTSTDHAMDGLDKKCKMGVITVQVKEMQVVNELGWMCQKEKWKYK